MRFFRLILGVAAASAALYAQNLAITSSATFPPGAVGSFYSLQLSASGGTPPYTWSETGTLPPGLSLGATNGVLLGTPTASGHFTFTLIVTDANRISVSESAAVTIASGTGSGLLTITTAGALPGASVGQSYSATLAASGGSPPYQWSAGQGIPAGIALNPTSGNLSGTPTTAGAFSFQVQVTDSAHNSAQASFTLTVTGSSLTITTAAPLFAGTVGVAYAQTFSASGGIPPYAWSILSGSTGALTLNASSGTLQGTPQSATTLSFTVQVADAAGARASQSFSILIQAPTLELATGAALPAGSIGVAYSQAIAASASGGTPPYTWSLTGLPAGLTFASSGLTISGTPSAAGSFTLTLQVTDSGGQSASRSLPFTVSAGALTITTARQLSAATLNVPFSETIVASGGSPPYNWAAAGLPAGLSINPGNGVISGTPTAAGTFSPVVLTVTDSALTHYSDNFSLSVALPSLPAVTIAGLPATAAAAEQYTLTITLASPYAANITGQAILTFTPQTGLGDSTIAFASGGGTASFSIPAGTLSAVSTVPLAIQTGTASGTLSVSLRLQAGGVDITPLAAPSVSTTIQPSAPVITNTQVTRTSNSVIIAVTGYATDLEVTQAVFTFGAASGQTLQSAASSITLDVSTLFGNWFGSSDLGGEFLFTQPFTITGDPTQVIPLTVTLVNRIGSVTANISQ